MHSRKNPIFAADLAKGMPCESATVPAAVSPRKVCQPSHCAAHPYGKATDSGESEDLPNSEFNCKPSGTRATLSAAISRAACDGFATFVQCVIINKLCVKIFYLSFRFSRQRWPWRKSRPLSKMCHWVAVVSGNPLQARMRCPAAAGSLPILTNTAIGAALRPPTARI